MAAYDPRSGMSYEAWLAIPVSQGGGKPDDGSVAPASNNPLWQPAGYSPPTPGSLYTGNGATGWWDPSQAQTLGGIASGGSIDQSAYTNPLQRTSTPYGGAVTGTPLDNSMQRTSTPYGAPASGNQTLGGLATTQPVTSGHQISTGDNIDPSSLNANGNYTAGMTMADYLNPQADYMQQQALKNIQSTYAGAGNLLSGPAMKGISDYSENMAQANAWQPAFNNYLADKTFNYGVDSGQQQFQYNAQNNDRNFNYNAALNDQTTPFSQQMQLAGLGVQGASIGANQNNTLAQLLSQNLLGGANASAAGTIGGSNALINALQQALGQYSNNSLLTNILNRASPTGP